MADRDVEVRLRANVTQYVAGMRAAGASTELALGRATKAATRQEAAMRAATTAGHLALSTLKLSAVGVAGGLALAAKVTADFEERMANVKSLSHANAVEMKALRAAAMSTGTAYGYTASEVADAETEMIKAGVSLKDIMGGGLKGALALAAAGQVDVGDATEIAATAMTQFGLKGRDIPHVADLLAAGADKALGSVTDLGYGMSAAGTTAHQLGFSIEDTVGTLAEFAQAGQKGEKGGTLLNSMLLRLSAPSKQAKKLMDEYGVSIYDANGQMKTMPEIAGNLQRSFKDLDPATRNAALGMIFGTRAIRGANIMIADGEKVNRKWINSVNDQGFAAAQASGKLDSLKGDLQKLKAAGENALIAVGTGEQAPLRRMVDNATHELQRLTENGDLEKWGAKAGKTIETVAHDIGTFAHDVGPAVSGIAHAIHGTVQEFDKIPTDLRKLLIYGGAGAAVGHKLGLDSLAKTLILGPGGGRAGASALGGRAGVTPVFVTNMGAGLGAGAAGRAGAGAGVAEGAAAGSLLTKARTLVIGAAKVYAAAGTMTALQEQLSSRKVLGGAFGQGHTLSHDLGAAYGATRFGGKFSAVDRALSAPFGGDTLTHSVDNVKKLDAALAKLSYAHPLQGQREFNRILGQSGLVTDHLRKVLPESSKALAAVGASSTGASKEAQRAFRGLAGSGSPASAMFRDLDRNAKRASDTVKRSGLSTQEYGKFLKGLPPVVRTAVKTPGLIKSRSDAVGLAKAFNLTPKQKTILLKSLGFDKTKKDVDTTSEKLKHLDDHLDDVGSINAVAKVKLKDNATAPAQAVSRYLTRLDRARANPTATLNDRATRPGAKVLGLMHQLDNTRPRPAVSLIDRATAAIERVRAHLRALDGQRAYTSVITRIETDRVTRFSQIGTGGGSVGTKRYEAPGSENGSLYRNGVKAFEAGGYGIDGRYYSRTPQIVAGGANVLWGEKATGWEAYISGKPSERARNIKVWSMAGDRLGAQDRVVGFAPRAHAESGSISAGTTQVHRASAGGISAGDLTQLNGTLVALGHRLKALEGLGDRVERGAHGGTSRGMQGLSSAAVGYGRLNR